MEARKGKQKLILAGLLVALLGSGQVLASNQELNEDKAVNNSNSMKTVESLLTNKMLKGGSHYDARIYRYIESRSVGSTNESWAISATRAVEFTSPYSIGYSERHLDYATAQNSTNEGTPDAHYRNLGGGGNSEVALGYYTSGRGPVSNQVEEWKWQDNLNKVSLAELQSQDVVNKIDEYTQFPSVYKYRQSGYTIAMDKDSSTMYTGGEVELNRDAIKEHILKYGSVIAKIYKADQYFQYNYMTESSEYVRSWDSENQTDNGYNIYYRHYYSVPGGLSYYCNQKDATPNHEIVLIGWDDDYTNAYTKAPTRGAYIALDADYFVRTWNNLYSKDDYYGWGWRNGWYAAGSNITTNQNVYYIPYDDYYVESNVYGIGKTSYVDYTSIYQHDPLGMSGTITGEYYNSEIYGANVFKRNTTVAQNLNEISVASKMPLKYEIYVNPRDGELTEEKLIKVATTDKLSAGYHTIKLDEGIVLTGDKFAIAVKYIADSESDKFAERTAKIGVETPTETYWEIQTDQTTGQENAVKKTREVQYWQNATSSPGQSYISNDMETWTDLYEKAETRDANICIKAFVSDNETYRVPAEKVNISKTELNIVKGDQEALSATIYPDNAADKKVYWTTSNRAVATVDQDGIVTAVAGGTAKITARSSNANVYAECIVNVKVPVENIVLNQKEVTMLANETYILAPIISPDDATTKDVQWSTSNKQVCLVTDDGLLIGLKQGRAIITALIKDEYGTHTATCTVVVPESLLVDVTEVRLNKSQMTIQKGERENLVATVYPDDATNKSVVWTSSNKSVAIVNANGRVTALTPGTTKITVTTVNGGETATCDVIVTDAEKVNVTGVSLNKTKLNLAKGDTENLVATIAPTNATNKNMTWTSSNEDVAFVNNSGKITAAGKGKATITVTTEDGQKTATCDVTVTVPDVRVTGISLNKTGATIKSDENLLLIANVMPYNATNKKVIWTSSNESIATVNQDGQVSAVSAGKATITAKTEDGNFTKTCVVTVTTDIGVTGIQLDATATVEVGRTIDLQAVVQPENATNKNVEWSITDDDEENDIAYVIDGKIIGVKEGTAIVTVKTEDGNYEASCTITVEASTAQVDLNTSKYLISSEDVIYSIPTETTIEEFVEGLKSTEGNIQVLDKEGNPVANDTNIGTGMTVQVTKVDENGDPVLDEETGEPIIETFDVIIEGDITGDGKITKEDQDSLINILISLETIEDKYIPALDFNKDGVIDIVDLTTMQDLIKENEQKQTEEPQE